MAARPFEDGYMLTINPQHNDSITKNTHHHEKINHHYSNYHIGFRTDQ